MTSKTPISKPRLLLRPRAIVLLAFWLAMTTGCGSLNTRSSPPSGGWDDFVYSKRYIYPGLEADVRMIIAPWQEEFQGHSTSCLAYIGIPMGLFDAPFSLAVDTIMLPYDVWMVTAGGKTRSWSKSE